MSESKILQQPAKLLKPKSLIILLIPSMLLGIALIFPEIYIGSSFNKVELRNRLINGFQSHRLKLTFDDVQISFYRGVILYNANFFLHEEPDRSILKAQYIALSFDRQLYFNEKKVKIERMLISKPSINMHIKLPLQNKGYAFRLLKALGSVDLNKVEIENAKITLNLERDDYESVRLNVKDSMVSIDLDKKEQLIVEYDDERLGFGKYSLQIIPCTKAQKKCKLSSLNHIIDFDQLPIEPFSKLLPKFSLKRSRINGNLTVVQNNSNDTRQSTEIDGTMKSEEVEAFKSIYKSLEIKLGAKLFKQEKKKQISIRAKSDGYEFNFDYNNQPRQVWPNRLHILIKTTGKSYLPIEPGIALSGLDFFELNLSKKKTKTYVVNASARIAQGELKLYDNAININNFKFHYQKQKFNTMGSIGLKSTQASFDLSGTIKPYWIRFKPLIDFYEEAFKTIKGFTTYAFETKIKGKLDFIHVNWADLEPSNLGIQNHIEERISKEWSTGQMKAYFIRRLIYKRYLKKMTMKVESSMKTLVVDDSKFNNFSGKLEMKYPDLSWVFESDQNAIDLRWGFASHYPSLRLKLNLNFQKQSKTVLDYLPPDLIQSFRKCELYFKYRGRGVRFVDLYKTRRMSGAFTFTDAMLGSLVLNSSETKTWNSVSASFKENELLGKIDKIKLENETDLFEGLGHYTVKRPDIRFKFKLKKKKQKIIP